MGVMRLERRVMCVKHDNEEAVQGKGRAWSSVIHLEVGMHNRGGFLCHVC